MKSPQRLIRRYIRRKRCASDLLHLFALSFFNTFVVNIWFPHQRQFLMEAGENECQISQEL